MTPWGPLKVLAVSPRAPCIRWYAILLGVILLAAQRNFAAKGRVNTTRRSFMGAAGHQVLSPAMRFPASQNRNSVNTIERDLCGSGGFGGDFTTTRYSTLCVLLGSWFCLCRGWRRVGVSRGAGRRRVTGRLPSPFRHGRSVRYHF